jgi:uncharacterized OB-fold protein
MSAIAKSPADDLFSLSQDLWTKPYWDAARERRLTAPRCGHCGRFRMPPTPFCPHCRSQEIEWPTLSGRGTIFSFTIVARAIVPAMEGSIPYVPALIDLDDAPGARLTTAIVDVPVDDIRIDAPVSVVFVERSDGVVVPRFTLASAAAPAG